ncbi:MAG TPA: isoprenylcysteine carboxylmethyltransferase family protein, partial [Chthoniobacterales bacterium]|nr:isoprenylcysteine carboxylmethyltransferase family protein [Chthoniobacterales bacterium]
SWLDGAAYRIPLLIGIFFVLLPREFLPFTGKPLWPQSAILVGIGIVLTIAGLGLAIWARVHLGKYWSGRVTIKVDHRIIESGPYGSVRHPIYSGLLLAVLGTVITIGTIQAFLGFALIFIAVIRKLTLEEKWLRSEFGEEYERYRRRVKALVPHL